MQKNNRRRGERGNVLYYIMIAVALLAALSFAVAQSGRTSMQTLAEDKQKLYSSEIIDYGHVLANATGQLRLRGIKETDVSFESPLTAANNYINPNCTETDCKVFETDGGGVTWVLLREEALDPAHSGAADYKWWSISGDYDVASVGSNCAGPDCKDLVAFANNLRKEVCLKINDLLGVSNPGGNPPASSVSLDPMANHFKGTYPNTATTLDGAGAVDKDALHNHTAACVKHDEPADPTYIYYQVLFSR